MALPHPIVFLQIDRLVIFSTRSTIYTICIFLLLACPHTQWSLHTLLSRPPLYCIYHHHHVCGCTLYYFYLLMQRCVCMYVCMINWSVPSSRDDIQTFTRRVLDGSMCCAIATSTISDAWGCMQTEKLGRMKARLHIWIQDAIFILVVWCRLS